jgi:hypothetical protein
VNDMPRFVRGTPALVFLTAVGGVSLALSARHLTQLDQSANAGFFIAGLACGYLVPLTFRIAQIVGRDRIERLRWLRLGLLALFFGALLVPLIIALTVPGAPPIIGGTLAMATLGTGLQDDRSQKAAA